MNDKAMRARNEGRDDVARRTVWKLEIGGFAVRCVQDPVAALGGAPYFTVEARDPRTGWGTEIASGRDPLELFEKVTGSIATFNALCRRLRTISDEEVSK